MIVNPWYALALLTVAQTGMSMAAFLWGPLAPLLVREFSLSAAQVGSLSALYYLVAAGLAIPGGMLVDRHGSRPVVIICQLVTALPLLALTLVSSFAGVLVCVALAAIGNSAINQASAQGVVQHFPPQRLGLAMSLRQTGNIIGGAITAAMVPWVGSHYGWRVSVALVASVLLIGSLVVFVAYRPARRSRDLSATRGSPRQRLLALLRDRHFLTILLLSPLVAYAQIAMVSFFALFVSDGLHLGPVRAGQALTVGLVAAGIGRVFWGVMADRFFIERRALSLALVTALAAFPAAGLALLTPGSGFWPPLLLGVILGGTGLAWQGLLVVVITEAAGKEDVGLALGTMINAAWAGWIVGPVAFGALVDHWGYPSAWSSVALVMLLCSAGFGWLSRQPVVPVRRADAVA